MVSFMASRGRAAAAARRRPCSFRRRISRSSTGGAKRACSSAPISRRQLRRRRPGRPTPGRTSEPRPWNRLAARLFDYAIWGLVLALLLSELRGAGLMPDALAFWIGHPLLAPVLITGTWVPIEALLIAALQTPPGKWLLGSSLQFSISDAYASRDTRSQLRRGLQRAFRVWWEGVGCGFPPLAPILIGVAHGKGAHNQET